MNQSLSSALLLLVISKNQQRIKDIRKIRTALRTLKLHIEIQYD